MKIDEVLYVVYKMETEHYRTTSTRPRFVIYMEWDYMGECYRELRSNPNIQKASHFEFLQQERIFGHQVFPVQNHKSCAHPSFRVHVMSEKEIADEVERYASYPV